MLFTMMSNGSAQHPRGADPANNRPARAVRPLGVKFVRKLASVV